MLKVHKLGHKPITVIRAATGHELSVYEKNKLAGIEENAQENKIEAVSVSINGKKQRLPIESKEVCLDLGELALKNNITPNELSVEDLFFIECSLNDTN